MDSLDIRTSAVGADSSSRMVARGDAHATVYLVSCVSKKRGVPAPARELYISDWFLKARRHVEGAKADWFILSAEYGLVTPDQELAPYDRTLLRMGVAERRAWAKRVLDALLPKLAGLERIVVFAGKRYRENVVPALEARGVRVEVPLERLAIGQQLRWFNERSMVG